MDLLRRMLAAHDRWRAAVDAGDERGAFDALREAIQRETEARLNDPDPLARRVNEISFLLGRRHYRRHDEE